MRIWLAIFASPLAWFTDHAVGYALVPPAHEHGRITSLIALHVAATIVCVVAGLGGARDLRSPEPRARFLAAAACAAAAISLLLVLGNAIVTLMLVPGAEP